MIRRFCLRRRTMQFVHTRAIRKIQSPGLVETKELHVLTWSGATRVPGEHHQSLRPEANVEEDPPLQDQHSHSLPGLSLPGLLQPVRASSGLERMPASHSLPPIFLPPGFFWAPCRSQHGPGKGRLHCTASRTADPPPVRQCRRAGGSAVRLVCRLLGLHLHACKTGDYSIGFSEARTHLGLKPMMSTICQGSSVTDVAVTRAKHLSVRHRKSMMFSGQT